MKGCARLQDVQYGRGGALGLAHTWPQAACCLPQRGGTPFDWRGDRPLGLPLQDLVIYEAHVRGFTWHDSSGVPSPGMGFSPPSDLPARCMCFAIT
jgi:isoamylase